MYANFSNMAPVQEESEESVLSYSLMSQLDSNFIHGSSGRGFGKYSLEAQEYMSSRCAEKWDGACDIVAMNPERGKPNMVFGQDLITGSRNRGLSSGEQMVRNAAFKRFVVSVRNCNLLCSPYNPNTPNSRLVCQQSSQEAGYCNPRWSQSFGDVPYGDCSGTYSLEHIQDLNGDVILNRLIASPYIAQDLLIHIYFNMKQNNTLHRLKGSNIGNFYQALGYQL